MSDIQVANGLQTLKINCHDPRSHQSFLQFSNDMHHWQAHLNDSNWWLEREKQCQALFQQYGYELQSGGWYCLIACQRNGWKGIASTSLLLADGFARQQTPCWPPLAAHDLRRQILDNYCRLLLPLIYALPVTTVSNEVLTQLLIATRLLEKHASTIQSTRQTAFRQLSVWLETRLSIAEQQGIPLSPVPRVSSVISPAPESVTPKQWSQRLLWSIPGAMITLLIMTVAQNITESDMLRFSNTVWPGNPWVEQWQQRMEKTSAALPINTGTQLLNLQLDALEQRLLDAEQKRKPYVTISELKTTIYQMHKTLNQQASMVENRLNQLQNQQNPESNVTISSVSGQLNELNNLLLYLSSKNKTN